MAFLYPGFLFALAAIAVPIVLHLIQLRRAKRIVFSNVRFIQASQDLTASQRRLKELLILFCRILFITFLVLAFAQPFIPASEDTYAHDVSDVAILVDNSYSSQNLQEDQDYSVLTGAMERGKSIVNLFPPSTAFSIATGNNYGYGRALNTADAKASLDALDFSSGEFPSLSKSNKASHIFLLSDYQKKTFKPGFLSQFDSTMQVHLVPISGSSTSNVAIDSVYLEDEFIRPSAENVLHVRILNTGENALEDVPVKLFVQDNQVAALSLDLPPKQITEAILTFRAQGNATQKAFVQVDDFPVDFDNTYYFTLNPSSKISITEIADAASPLQRMYRNEPLFSYTIYTASNPDYAQLSGSDFIILNGLKEISGALAATVANYVKAGGTLLICPAADGDASSYSNLFQSINVPASLTPLTDKANKTTLTAPDPNNPFFKSIFSGYDARMQMPAAARSLLWSKSSDDILEFRGGAPYLSRFDRGNGKVYLIAAPLQEDYNKLVNHALFVPVMYKLAISAYKQEQALAYTLDEGTIRIPLKTIPGKEGVYELQQDSIAFIPEQQIRGGNLYFSVPADMNKAGFYTLKRQGQELYTLAFNYNKKESDLAQYTPDELRALTGNRKNVHVYDYGNTFSVKGEFEKRYFGVKLWKYCLILCLFFLIVEIALIRFL